MKRPWMLAAGALVLALAASAPWLVGKATETQWQRATAELNRNQALFRLETGRYDRHYLSADVSGRLVFTNPETGRAMTIPFQGEVSHGLLGSELDVTTSERFHALGQPLFGERRPHLMMASRLWGTVTLELNVPAVSVENTATGESFNAAEAYGWARITNQGRDAEIDLRWPGMAARAPGVRLTFDDLRLSQQLQQVRGQLWQGGGELTLAQVSLADTDQPAVVLKGIAVRGKTTATDDQQRFDSEAELEVDELAVADTDYGQQRVSFAIQGAHLDSWNRLSELFADLQSLARPAGQPTRAQVDRQLALMAELSDTLKALAGHGLTVAIPELLLQTPEGDIAGRASLQHPLVPEAERANLHVVMDGLVGDLALAVPAALVDKNPQLARDVLRPLQAQGLVVRDDDVYRIEARLKDRVISVNETSIPLPPLI